MLKGLFESLLRTVWNAGRERVIRPARLRRKVASQLLPVAAAVSLGKIVRSPFAQLPEPDAPTELMLTSEEMRKHVYLLGSTGSGKSNLLRQLVMKLIVLGIGVCIVDARGELIDQILLLLASLFTAEELRTRLLLIDFRDTEFSIPVNPILDTATDAYTRVSFLMNLLKSTFEIGVQTEQLLRNSLLALTLSKEKWSLNELELFLTMPAVRTRVLESVADASVQRFFRRFNSMRNQSAWVEPCLNKVSPFVSRPALRNSLAQHDTVSFHKLLDERPDMIILCSLSVDTLHGDGHLMGSVLAHSLISAAMRPNRRDKHGNELALFVDEFENFTGLDEQFASIISEGRKFGLGACLSHQSSGQLSPKLRNLIRNVCGTQIYFSVGGGEAETLAGEIATDEPKALIRNLLMNQKVGECVVVRRGQPYTRIRTRLAPDPDVAADKVKAIRRVALEHFGRRREDIEAELARREEALLTYRAPVPTSNAGELPDPNMFDAQTEIQVMEVDDDEDSA